MRVHYCAVAAVILLVFVMPASSQSTDLSIDIAGVTIPLGISKEQALALFRAANISVIDATRAPMKPDSEEWFVCERGQTDIEKCNTVGQLDFTNHVLVMAMSQWGVNAKSATDSALALYGAVQDMRKRGFHTCELNTHATSDNDHTYNSVSFNCGRFAYISLVVTKRLGGSSDVVVEETISAHDLPGLD